MIQEIFRDRIIAIERETSVRVIEQTRKIGRGKRGFKRESYCKLDCQRWKREHMKEVDERIWWSRERECKRGFWREKEIL